MGPEGTSRPIRCPSGKYSKAYNNKFYSLAKSLDRCIPCSPGFYCISDGDGEPCGQLINGTNFGGYVCTGGSDTPTPSIESGMGFGCPVGHECPPGAIANYTCP